MVSSDKAPPMLDYVVKLLLLEALRCSQSGDTHGLAWVQDVLYELNLKLDDHPKKKK